MISLKEYCHTDNNKIVRFVIVIRQNINRPETTKYRPFHLMNLADEIAAREMCIFMKIIEYIIPPVSCVNSCAAKT